MTPAEHYAELFLKGLRKEIQTVSERLLTGVPDELAAYREMVGQLRALKTAERIAQEALKVVAKDS
jgi:hypothetical protein